MSTAIKAHVNTTHSKAVTRIPTEFVRSTSTTPGAAQLLMVTSAAATRQDWGEQQRRNQAGDEPPARRCYADFCVPANRMHLGTEAD